MKSIREGRPDFIIKRTFTEQMLYGANSKIITEMINDMLDDMAKYIGAPLKTINNECLCFYFGETIYQGFNHDERRIRG